MVRSRAHSKPPTPCAARLVAAYLAGPAGHYSSDKEHGLCESVLL